MANLLKQLELDELSLVDRPANAEAMVSLFKRDTSEENMTEELNKEVKTLKAENERLRKALIDNGYVIKSETIEKKAQDEFIEVEGEKINKADVPAAILKRLEKAEVEKADAVLTKKAEEKLPHFAVDVAKGLLVAIEKSTEAEILMEALMAADKAFEDKMAELGKADAEGQMGSAEEELNKLSKAYQKEHKVTEAQAKAAVYKTDEGQILLKKYYKGE